MKRYQGEDADDGGIASAEELAARKKAWAEKKAKRKSAAKPKARRATSAPAKSKRPVARPKAANAGASVPPTQKGTPRSQTDASPRGRTAPAKPSTPSRGKAPSRPAVRTKPKAPSVPRADVVNKPKKEYTYAQWQKMTRSQREAAGLPTNQLDAQKAFKRFRTGVTGKQYTVKGK